jgi:hypothetical protein
VGHLPTFFRRFGNKMLKKEKNKHIQGLGERSFPATPSKKVGK